MHQHILKVSELTKKVRFLLESELNSVWLSGEISNFIKAASGHWYLSLKDSQSQVKCAMFKGANQRVRIDGGIPKNGMQVLVRAKVSLYEPRGDFQLIIEHLESAGEGLLRQQYEQLKNKLNAQGLFDRSYKQALPPVISHVGIVTSPTGAAVKDILTVLKRRNPAIKVTIYPALVQGQYAKDEIVSAIEQANRKQIIDPDNSCQVLIVGRGGGSLEDLWPFNEEAVVRAIYDSNLPIVSAVGHEIDTTLSDFVADLRAPTPSAAAELVSTDISTQLDKMAVLSRRLLHTNTLVIGNKRALLANVKHRLTQVHPLQQLQHKQQKADDLQLRLHRTITAKLSQVRTAPKQLTQRLLYLTPAKVLQVKQLDLKQLQQRLHDVIFRIQQKKIDRFTQLIEQLHIVSPLATIARGYSISRSERNTLITSTSQTAVGEKVRVQVSDGELSATVTDITINSPK